ncbi:MAG: TIGR01906 family membrane protein [Thermanaerothrix sp.]|uniref:TIGR01906 family membrane protein n=1 Tax=Thermanaerothrix solaris TaxID=3058434 RepID=A0ABU3NL96_9CHLR|nr:TIGR01906 family membrane protein [Thermanaerothrix sp. 4228-RoL]MDT8897567.1 TIGR01906 family membrane protein [Thermanaerothrix sp. 4228-RoL]
MKRLSSWLLGLTTILLPLLLITTAIRILLTPTYLQIAYRLPAFPPDPFGFTTEERLYWANYSLTYLLNQADISFLADQTLSNGQPLYNARELRHMVDVKNLVQLMLHVWTALIIFYGVVGIWFWRTHQGSAFWRALSRGGWLTLGLILLILIGVVVSFNWLFTAFHRLFFEGDTWLFYYSDTLIRLFPLRFWQDAFTAMGLLTLTLALITALGGQKLASRTA